MKKLLLKKLKHLLKALNSLLFHLKSRHLGGIFLFRKIFIKEGSPRIWWSEGCNPTLWVGVPRQDALRRLAALVRVARLLRALGSGPAALVDVDRDRGLGLARAGLPCGELALVVVDALADLAVELLARLVEVERIQLDLERELERELAQIGAGVVLPVLLDATGHRDRPRLRDEGQRGRARELTDHVDEVVDDDTRHELDGGVLLDGLLDEVLGAVRDATDRAEVVGLATGVAFGAGQGVPSGSVLTGTDPPSLENFSETMWLHYIMKTHKSQCIYACVYGKLLCYNKDTIL